MFRERPALLACLGVLLAAGPLANGQDAPSPQATPAPAASPAAGTPGFEGAVPTPQRPGRFQLGALWLTPRIQIGTIGFDSNTLYEPTEPKPDLNMSGGPGLLGLVPFGSSSKFFVDGSLTYVYFERTARLRRFNWNTSAGFERKTDTALYGVTENYGRTSARTDNDVDTRVVRDNESTSVQIVRPLAGHLGFRLSPYRGTTKVVADETFVGNDLSPSLTQRRYGTGAELNYALTAKTALFLQGEYRRTTFPQAIDARNGNLRSVSFGIRTDPDPPLGGQLSIGIRSFSFDGSSVGQKGLIADSNLQLGVSPTLKINLGYRRSRDYSGVTVVSGNPTYMQETTSAGFTKDLFSRCEWTVSGQYMHLATDGVIVVTARGSPPQIGRRDDTAWRAQTAFGYRVRDNLKIGLDANYVQRRSTFAYFGISGLLAGFTVDYTP